MIGSTRDCSSARIDAALQTMRSAHGATMACASKSTLRGALQLAVRASVLGANLVRDELSEIRSVVANASSGNVR
jgi:hypothetical protein